MIKVRGLLACAIVLIHGITRSEASIRKSQFNDDICDEPGHAPVIVYSSRVNDSIFDCFDGSDEYDGKTKCSNTCWEAVTICQKEIEQAELAMDKDEEELLMPKDEEKIPKELVEKIKERKDLIEKAEENGRLQKENERKEAEEANKEETKAEDNESMHNDIHDNAETADQPSQDFKIQNIVACVKFLVVNFIKMMSRAVVNTIAITVGIAVMKKIIKIKYPFTYLTFPEYNGYRSLDFFYIGRYVNAKCIDQARRRYGHFDGEALFFTIAENEEVWDEFEGTIVWWTLFKTPQEDHRQRYFHLTFHRQCYQTMTTRYLAHVLSEGKSITLKQWRRTWLEACRD